MDELDITVLMKKVRDSYDIISNLVNREYRNLLTFNTKRVVYDRCESSFSAPESSCDNFSNSDDGKKDKNIGFKEHIRLGVIRGLDIDEEERWKLKYLVRKK